MRTAGRRVRAAFARAHQRYVHPPPPPYEERQSKARLWREILVVRAITLVALGVALALVELEHPRLVWVMFGVAVVQVPTLFRALDFVGVIRPLFPLVDSVTLALAAWLEPQLIPYLSTLVIASVAYATSTFGSRIGGEIGVIASVILLGATVTLQPEGWVTVGLVHLVAALSVTVICGRAAESSTAIRARVGDILESVGAVAWEAPGADEDPTVIYGPIERLYGWPVEQHLQHGNWAALVHPDDAGVADDSRAACARGENHAIRYRVRRADGQYRWVEEHIGVELDGNGVVSKTRGVGRDITDSVEASLLSARYEELVRSLPYGAVICDVPDPDDMSTMRVVAANETIDVFTAPVTGQAGDEPIREFLAHAQQASRVTAALARVVRSGEPLHVPEADLRALGRKVEWAAIHIIPLPGHHVAVIAEDVTDAVATRRNLETLAYRDTLTMLPNRAALLAQLDRLIDAEEEFTLAVLDLDQFKEVNDAFGHAVGDELLVAVSAALEHSVPAGSTVSRLGGDEFAVIAPMQHAHALRLGDLLRAALERPLVLPSGLTLQASASIGLASFPATERTTDGLLRCADVAMYSAKRAISGSALYAHDLDRSSARRMTLLGDLRRAIDDGELVLHYQPIVELGSGMVRRVEGLVRWQHPGLGLLLPGEFIELTELNNLNRGVVRTTVAQGLAALVQWRAAGHEVGVSVNVGGNSLADAGLITEVLQMVDAADVPRHTFGIELTERQLLLDTPTSMQSFDRLAEAGIWISIDDFGTGTSSLWALREIPACELKIDRTFVEDLRKGESALIRSIVSMAHDLGLEVVAEGVEDEVTYRWLRDTGCDHVQGYLFARPMPARQLTELLGAPLRPTRPARPSMITARAGG